MSASVLTRVRLATPDDAEALWRILHHPSVADELLDPDLPADATTLANRLAALEPSRREHVIERAASTSGPWTVIGTLTLVSVPGPPCPWASFAIAIDPDHRRQGHAMRALERLPELLLCWPQVEAIAFGVFADNLGAQRLYARLGYRIYDRIWMRTPDGGRKRALMLSDKPERFARRRAGFR